MKIRYEETKQQVELLDNQVKTMERKYEDLAVRVYEILENLCTSIMDPQMAQRPNWKSYWQEQAKVFEEIRTSRAKSKQ